MVRAPSGFAFCSLLGFDLLPASESDQSTKALRARCPQRSSLHEPHTQYSERPINWALIEQQYDEMVKYTTALREGTADAESIMRRFTRDNAQHPTDKALIELGKAGENHFPVSLPAGRKRCGARSMKVSMWLRTGTALMPSSSTARVARLPPTDSRSRSLRCCRCTCLPDLPGVRQHADDTNRARPAGLGGSIDGHGSACVIAVIDLAPQSLRANRAQHGQTHRVRGVNSGSVNYSQNTSFVQC